MPLIFADANNRACAQEIVFGAHFISGDDLEWSQR